MPIRTVASAVVFSCLATIGCSKADEKDGQIATSTQPMAEGQAMHESRTPKAGGTIDVAVGDDGFVPSHVDVEKGNSVTLRFTRTSDATCAKEVVFPELKLKKALPLNQAVDIVIPANEAKTITFQCGMGMFKSQLVVKG
jgi:plastocyanin domain-containing protein